MSPLSKRRKKYSATTWRLVEMFNSSPKLRTDLEKIFQKIFPDADTLTIDDLYDFLDTSLISDYVSTEFETHAYRILKRLATIPEGKDILNSKIIQIWLRDYLKVRKEYLDSPHSAKILPIFFFRTKMSGGSLEDYYIPKGGFTSFNEFFTRQLKPGKRPISNPRDDSVVVSPVDGKIGRFREIVGSKELSVKNGVKISIKKILMNSKLARRFNEGMRIGFWLEYWDYHRYHTPVTGTIIEAGHSGVVTFGVRPWKDFLEQQYRGYYMIDTPNKGLVAMVMFGMSEIESVNLTHNVDDIVSKGDDLGFFALGGSYVLLLFERPLDYDKSIPLRRSFRMGQKIGVFASR